MTFRWLVSRKLRFIISCYFCLRCAEEGLKLAPTQLWTLPVHYAHVIILLFLLTKNIKWRERQIQYSIPTSPGTWGFFFSIENGLCNVAVLLLLHNRESNREHSYQNTVINARVNFTTYVVQKIYSTSKYRWVAYWSLVCIFLCLYITRVLLTITNKGVVINLMIMIRIKICVVLTNRIQ
jgi:hypothetical protein